LSKQLKTNKMAETAVDEFFRKTILECTFDTNRNIYDNCKIKEKLEFKRFFDLGVMALYQQKDNLNKEKSFEYWYNKYLEQ
jgi:hypothetical protein